MSKLLSQRVFCLVTGGALFMLGVFGFAFRTSFDLPDKYLFGSLVLGFWGLVVAFNTRGKE